MAHRLIQHFGTLDAVFQAPPEALMQVSGIGENAAVLLNLVPAAQRCARRSVSAERILNSVERCGAYFMDLLDGQRRELLYQVCLDGKGKVLSCKCLSQGSADMTSLSIRQVVENALLSGAAGVVLGHNHPSGVALPSAEDRAATLQVRDALATMDIRLLDLGLHLITGRDFLPLHGGQRPSVRLTHSKKIPPAPLHPERRCHVFSTKSEHLFQNSYLHMGFL